MVDEKYGCTRSRTAVGFHMYFGVGMQKMMMNMVGSQVVWKA